MKKIQILESVRGFAAVYVLLSHSVANRFSVPPGIELLLSFGQEAVMLFFLLSGFVIFYSFSKRPLQSFGEYLHRRALRIYPIYILSLFLAYFSFCLSQKHWAAFDAVQFLGNLFMLQDYASVKPGVWFNPFFGNAALWSLSYEWWFYMMFFPIVTLLPNQKQKWLVAAIALGGFFSYFVLPNQIGLYLTYFIIWWTGVEIAKTYATGVKPTIRTLKSPLLLLVFFAALQLASTLFYWKIAKQPIAFGLHPVLELRHFLFAVLVVTIALGMPELLWKLAHKILVPFGIFAPMSYAIYVFHIPLIAVSRQFSFMGSPPLEYFLYLSMVFFLAYIAEVPLQRAINHASKRVAAKPLPTVR